MSSLIEGYNYNIFISCCRKDNKGWHWVSEFVEALTKEPESTFLKNTEAFLKRTPYPNPI